MQPSRNRLGHGPSRLLALACGVLLLGGPAAAPAATGIAVLDFELRNLTPIADSQEDLQRAASIRPMLEAELHKRPDTRIVSIDPVVAREADAALGYLFEHSDAAAELGRAHGADWILVGRLHKPSFLFAYLMARLIDTGTGKVAEDLIVEIKGQQEVVTRKGVERLAQKLDARLAAGSSTAGSRDSDRQPQSRPASHTP